MSSGHWLRRALDLVTEGLRPLGWPGGPVEVFETTKRVGGRLLSEVVRVGVGSLLCDFCLRPDDPLHSYSVIRAWDRHLKLQGLLPIGTDDLSKVGPILQDPGGEYIVYGYNEQGHLTSWRQILL